MPDNPHSRDTALARLVGEALSRSQSGGTEQSSACADAEILAAYAEHGLAEEEKAHWESHFADCVRCQKIIAVLVASDDELTDTEVERLGNLAAASTGSSVAPRAVAENSAWWRFIWRGPVLWRWLVPVAGMASAAGLWLALHQAPVRKTLSSQKNAAPVEAPQNGAARGDMAASSAKPDQTQIAQGNLPAPPALAPPPEAPLRDNERESSKSPAAAKKEQLQKQEASSNAVQVPPASQARRAVETREYDAKDNRLQPAPPAEPKSQASDALSVGAAAPAAPVASPPAPPPETVARAGERQPAERQQFDRAAGAPPPAQLKTFAQVVNQTIVFASPGGRVLWRLGSAGRIERSTDRGQTWQPQSSGVTTDLLAGTAPSETVAWAVGRDGIILRTQDGEHWQRVAAPSPTQPASATPPADWTGVEGRDAGHATITSRDLRRFATEDGGRTWTPVQ